MTTAITDAVAIGMLMLPVLVLGCLVVSFVVPWFSRSWREADNRADVLVRSLLTEDEYRQLQLNGFLDIPSPNYPQRVYRVPIGAGTVSVLELGRCVDRLCVSSTARIPERESILMHKLMIEGNEHHYLRTANHLPP